MRLINTHGEHNKFWEGSVTGQHLSVRFGRIGTPGQTKVKEFDSAAAANAELAKLVKEKRAKGYMEEGEAAAVPESGGPVSAPSLPQALAALDALWKKKLPRVFGSLRPGIDVTGNLALATILGGRSLPAEIATWFAWHDGQKSDEALSEESVYFLHSVDGAIETWNFLQDMKEESEYPANPAWLPMFQNGGGDHRCYDLESGAIVTYYHDSADRDVAFTSLNAWAEATRTALDKLAVSQPVVGSLEGLRWTKVSTAPTLDTVSELEAGTAFSYTQKLAMGVRVSVVIKTKNNTWLRHSGLDLAGALANLEEHLHQPPGKNSGYWRSDSLLPMEFKAADKGTLRRTKAIIQT